MIFYILTVNCLFIVREATPRRKGDYVTAEATLLRALAVNEKMSGLAHPQTIDTMRVGFDVFIGRLLSNRANGRRSTASGKKLFFEI